MLRFADPGGAIYQTAGTGGANILAHWTLAATISTWFVSAGNGRITGTPSLRANPLNNGQYLAKTIPSVQTIGIAFAIRLNTAAPSASVALAAFFDTGTTQVDLRIRTDGTLQVTRNGTSLGTSTVALSSGVYYHIEFKAKINSSTGTVEVRLNGTPVIGPLTAQNTQNTGNATANAAYLGNTLGGTFLSTSVDFCDIVVWDGDTTIDANGFADIHDFIGDCAVIWLLPTADGTTKQFSPDTGSTNYTQVNDTTPNGDTSYVQSTTVNNIDTYAMANLPGNILTVKSVAVVAYADKTDTGARGLTGVIRSGGANAIHPTAVSLSTNYLYNFWGYGQDPAGGVAAPWTPAAVNAAESGQQVSS